MLAIVEQDECRLLSDPPDDDLEQLAGQIATLVGISRAARRRVTACGPVHGALCEAVRHLNACGLVHGDRSRNADLGSLMDEAESAQTLQVFEFAITTAAKLQL